MSEALLPWVDEDVDRFLARVAHYPGGHEHDQGRHGGGKGGPDGPTFANTPEEIMGVLDRAGILAMTQEQMRVAAYPLWEKGTAHEDELLTAIVRAQGFDRPGKTVSENELMDGIAAGEVTEGWRGVLHAEHQMALRDGPYYSSVGLSTNGIFVSVPDDSPQRSLHDDPASRRVEAARAAANYATEDPADLVPSPDGGVAHLGIERSARIVTRDQLNKEWSVTNEGFFAEEEKATARGDKAGWERWMVGHYAIGNAGRYAALRGYDVIDNVGSSLGAPHEMVVLNRGALRVAAEMRPTESVLDGEDISAVHPRVPHPPSSDTNPAIERALQRVKDGTLPTTADVEERIRKQAQELGIGPSAAAAHVAHLGDHHDQSHHGKRYEWSRRERDEMLARARQAREEPQVTPRWTPEDVEALVPAWRPADVEVLLGAHVAHYPGGHEHDQGKHSGGKGGTDGMVLAEGMGAGAQFCMTSLSAPQQKAATAEALMREMDGAVFSAMELGPNGIRMSSRPNPNQPKGFGDLRIDPAEGSTLTQDRLIERTRRAGYDPGLTVVTARYSDEMLRVEMPVTDALHEAARAAGGPDAQADMTKVNEALRGANAGFMVPPDASAREAMRLMKAANPAAGEASLRMDSVDGQWAMRTYTEAHIHQWAISSNDTAPRSLAIQKVAGEMFGAEGGKAWAADDVADEWLSRLGPALRWSR